MNKYNRKFITRYKRFERWHNISCKLSEFNRLIKPFDGATPDDVQAMKEIHKRLHECRVISGEYLEATRINDRFLR